MGTDGVYVDANMAGTWMLRGNGRSPCGREHGWHMDALWERTESAWTLTWLAHGCTESVWTLTWLAHGCSVGASPSPHYITEALSREGRAEFAA